MEFIIALLAGLLAFILAYRLLYQSRLRASQAGRRLNETLRVDDLPAAGGPDSPEYRLAQAGLRTQSPRAAWLFLHWAPPVLALAAAFGAGFPAAVGLAAAGLAALAPRRWLDGRIRDRGRRLDGEIPRAYVRLLSVLRASPDVGMALTEVSDSLELEAGGPTPLSTEFRQTAAEMASHDIGREEGLRRLQRRASSVSLANLGLLLERFAQTGGDRFYASFESAAGNVQGILDARQKAQAKAAEQIQSARIIPVLLVTTLLFFMNDPGFASGFRQPLVQLALAGAAAVMFAGYTIMTDIAREAV